MCRSPNRARCRPRAAPDRRRLDRRRARRRPAAPGRSDHARRWRCRAWRRSLAVRDGMTSSSGISTCCAVSTAHARGDRSDDLRGHLELCIAVGDAVALRDPTEVGLGDPHLPVVILVHEQAHRPVEACLWIGGEELNAKRRIAEDQKLRRLELRCPASAPSCAWSTTRKNVMPFFSMSACRRSTVSSTP